MSHIISLPYSPIRVKTANSAQFLDLPESATTLTVQSAIRSRFRILPPVSLYSRGSLLAGNSPLSQYTISQGDWMMTVSKCVETHTLLLRVKYYNNTFALECPSQAKAAGLKFALSFRIGLFPEHMSLLYAGRKLQDGETIAEVFSSALEPMLEVESSQHALAERGFPICVRFIKGEIIQLTIGADATTEDLKVGIAEEIFRYVAEIRLIYAGKGLEDGRRVGEYGIGPGSIVNCVLIFQ